MKIVKRKIMTPLLLSLIVLGTYSCGESKPKGWSDKEKTEFVSSCAKANNGVVSDEKAKELCTCMLHKMVEQYPTMVASQSMSVDEIKAMALSCN
ncbi:hypothetical protein [Cellulophaga sp. L1A9]|uniref:hypothetical protein n=1 Tax=Cellulophaga sp. L1A9 TaxID=2686362 RepID=UPI00131CCC43|nr:hypothetical protein [Cellulophaga sp. L1A9]